jgi:hypothetical protein
VRRLKEFRQNPAAFSESASTAGGQLEALRAAALREATARYSTMEDAKPQHGNVAGDAIALAVRSQSVTAPSVLTPTISTLMPVPTTPSEFVPAPDLQPATSAVPQLTHEATRSVATPTFSAPAVTAYTQPVLHSSLPEQASMTAAYAEPSLSSTATQSTTPATEPVATSNASWLQLIINAGIDKVAAHQYSQRVCHACHSRIAVSHRA